MIQTDSGLNRSLSLLLQGLSGSDIPVQFMVDTEDVNPSVCMRPIINPQHVLLPVTLLNPGIEGLNVLARASIAHAAAHLLFSKPARDVTSLKPMGVAVASAIEDARVEYLLIKQLPGIKRWFCQAMLEQVEEPSVFSKMIARLSVGLLNEQAHTDDYWVNKARTLFFSAKSESGLEAYDAYRAIASILANDLGQMRIQFNAQAYVNPVRYRDDNSYLWNFSSQQSEPELSVDQTLTELIQPARAKNLADTQQNTEFDIQTFLYPELDYRSGIERPDWCTVLEYRHGQPGASRRADLSQYMTRKKLRTYKNNARVLSRQKLYRQQEGELLDMNAVVDSVALSRQGVMGDGHHYIGHALREKNVSLLLILDLSASVGNVIPGQTQTILELEKAAAMMLANYALGQGDRIAVHGFCSDRRTGIHYFRYLDFDQPFFSSGLQALEQAEHQYSTRMGAAIRHSANFFNDAQTDARAIILMTDGAPSDIDVFDPHYLVEDARAVVRQSIQKGIDVYGLVMDPTAVEQTIKIFGAARHRIVSRTQSLPMHLESLYRQIKA